MKTTGKVFKYGDHVDTDVIIPARFLNTSNHSELASHCMEDIDENYVKEVEKGDVIVGGETSAAGRPASMHQSRLKQAAQAALLHDLSPESSFAMQSTRGFRF